MRDGNTRQDSKSMQIVLALILFPVVVSAVYYDPYENDMRVSSPPTTYDLRKSGRVFPPLNQKECKSCYVHAVATILEYWAGSPLSHQYILDCSRNAKNRGCRRGGFMQSVLEWLHFRRIPIDDDVEFTRSDSKCHIKNATKNVVVFDFDSFRGEKHLDNVIWTSGPVATDVYLTNELQTWHGGGIMKPSQCGVLKGQKHSVAIVGYGPDYWLIKNSWGTNWADNGYAKLQRGTNTCGIGKENFYIHNAGITT